MRGQVDLAVALAGMRIAGPQQRARHMHGHVERRTGDEIANIHVAGVFARRDARVAAGLLARDGERAREWPQRQNDAGQELGLHACRGRDNRYLTWPSWIDARELAEHSRHVEVRRVGARDDLVEPDLEHVARLRFLDIDRSGQSVRPAAGEIGAQFLDLLDGRARHHLVVAVHHRFEHDGVAGIARAAPAAGHCRTSPIAWFRASPAAHAPSCRSASPERAASDRQVRRRDSRAW